MYTARAWIICTGMVCATVLVMYFDLHHSTLCR